MGGRYSRRSCSLCAMFRSPMRNYIDRGSRVQHQRTFKSRQRAQKWNNCLAHIPAVNTITVKAVGIRINCRQISSNIIDNEYRACQNFFYLRNTIEWKIMQQYVSARSSTKRTREMPAMILFCLSTCYICTETENNRADVCAQRGPTSTRDPMNEMKYVSLPTGRECLLPETQYRKHCHPREAELKYHGKIRPPFAKLKFTKLPCTRG